MKYLLLSAAVVICLNATAQRIFFSDSTNRWSGYSYQAFPTVYYHYTTFYRGDTTIDNIRYQISNGFGIREDKVNGQIFCRFLTPYSLLGANYPTDTAEHLLFDYNLRVNDTFRVNYGAYHSTHYVGSIDSVQVDGLSYKVWNMMPQDRLSFPGNLQYSFLEGTGTLNMPFSSVCNWFFESGYRLLCFENNSRRPVFSRKLDGYFDDDASCRYWPVAVNIVNNSAPFAFPNPVGTSTVLNIPEGFINARLLVFDALGKRIEVPIQHQPTVPIGSYLSTPGNYFYLLLDASGKRFTGHFIFQ